LYRPGDGVPLPSDDFIAGVVLRTGRHEAALRLSLGCSDRRAASRLRRHSRRPAQPIRPSPRRTSLVPRISIWGRRDRSPSPPVL